MERLGIGIGWRPEIADDIARLPDIDWVEVVAENICPGHLPEALRALRERGTTVVPHGVSLGLGDAARPDEGRLAALAARAETLGAPLVSEHIAFVRGGGPLTASPPIEAGHLLPVPRTREALAVLCENVRIAQEALPVPLALENIAALISWPGEELTEGQFLTELVERTGVHLLIDVANLHTNHVNRGEDPAATLDSLPTWAIAYVHVAGGVERDGVWHDSHAHPVSQPVLDVLAELRARTAPAGVLLERDDAFPEADELAGELDAIRAVLAAGSGPASTGPKVAPGRPAATATAVAPPPSRALAPARGARVPPPRSPVTLTVERPAAHRAVASAPGAGAATRPDATAAAGAAPRAGGRGRGEPERQRLALAQTALLSALVAGTPAPEGFDRRRLRVQSRALVAKRAEVVAKVAPELPEILGSAYRPAFLAYARHRPLGGGYRRDALAFAERLLAVDEFADPVVRRRLTAWWRERSGPAPLSSRPAARLLRAVRLGWGRA
ncbi:DUF692 family multinuclear iron-containing protein [Streptomyces sp. NPDC057702]|uniref:multinuclear nonheme iron-dependent oxidase n=1 Tax=unclassified Streptomyces TaxID=2593676 RepID=UPI0036BFF9FC